MTTLARNDATPVPTYTTSDGTAFVPENAYPEWNWDTVQEYKMFGDNHLLTDDDVKRIAALSNFICIEKQHGKSDLGAAELGAKHETTRFKAINPDIKVLFYFNGAIPYAFTTYTKNFSPKQNKMTDQEKEDLLIFDAEKNEYYTSRNGSIYAYDILKPALRTWWSDTVGKAVRKTGTDGVFWDQMHGWAWLRPRKARQEVGKAHVKMQKLTRTAMGKDTILLCNNAAHNQEFIENCDAVMYEHYAPQHYRDNFQKYVDDWDQMLAVANAGKINVYRWGVNLRGTKYEAADRRAKIAEKNHAELAEIAKNRVTFPLACFLVGAQPYSYFMLSWGWGVNTGALVDFPEMKKPLGPPLGSYERQSEGKWVFTRRFKHADVWVDLEKEEGRITWKQSDSKADPR
ncbi:MAG: hypothetical protein HN742_35895 [Lentisphaerae bacterium]|nr:hypothetical protein [Lentisphaerota bacterium]MBT4820269.1 hypothetical protein [Lentisphaerota bacterium]MBT5609778.1 hypothetical protein [Lentisphaerota bacterium]MBT7062090.1 hypothetical protein [Lentisphaerota bacterium]MBT7847308.1 hypothetical protein [Lentisphaerota bacterium]